MSTWDAARLASRRPLPKPRKMHGPVGEPVTKLVARLHLPEPSPSNTENQRVLHRLDLVDGKVNDWCDQCCPDCGYHVCSCAPVEPPIPMVTIYVSDDVGPIYVSDGDGHLITLDELNRKLVPMTMFGIDAAPESSLIWNPIEPKPESDQVHTSKYAFAAHPWWNNK